MKKILLKLIDIYQKTPGRIHLRCRYTPTCSEYAKIAITEYGALYGSFLGVKRILKCNPLFRPGYDPVKIKRKKDIYEKNIINN